MRAPGRQTTWTKRLDGPGGFGHAGAGFPATRTTEIDLELIFDLGLIAVAIAVYLLPAIAAFDMRHHNAPAIAALNVLLGWTLIGWALAFVWALTRR